MIIIIELSLDQRSLNPISNNRPSTTSTAARSSVQPSRSASSRVSPTSSTNSEAKHSGSVRGFDESFHKIQADEKAASDSTPSSGIEAKFHLSPDSTTVNSARTHDDISSAEPKVHRSSRRDQAPHYTDPSSYVQGLHRGDKGNRDVDDDRNVAIDHPATDDLSNTEHDTQSINLSYSASDRHPLNEDSVLMEVSQYSQAPPSDLHQTSLLSSTIDTSASAVINTLDSYANNMITPTHYSVETFNRTGDSQLDEEYEDNISFVNRLVALGNGENDEDDDEGEVENAKDEYDVSSPTKSVNWSKGR